MEIKIVIDDRIVNVLKRLTDRKVVAVIGLLLAAVPLVVYGAVPYLFEDGNIIYADQMNANFDNLDGRIAPYESAIHVDAESGNVGIGTTSPQSTLDIAGDIVISEPSVSQSTLSYRSGKFTLNLDSAGTDGIYFRTYSGGYGDRMVIKNTGNVGIGTTSPQEKLDVNGNVKIVALAGSGTAYVCVDEDGVLFRSAVPCK